MSKVSELPFVCHPCPHCGAPDAVVRAAETVLGHPRQIKLRVECLKCHHSWHTTEDHETGEP